MTYVLLFAQLGTTLVSFICLWKLQSILLVLQGILEVMGETKDEKIGFRSETAPPDGTEGDYVDLEFHLGEADDEYQQKPPLVYDKGSA